MRCRSGIIAACCILPTMVVPRALVAQDRPGPDPLGQSQGAKLFASNCAACHGADGGGGEHAPDIATSSDVQRLPNQNLTGIVKNGISGTGMPAFNWLGQEKISSIVAYLRTLGGKSNSITLPGNAEQGEKVFFGKAQCSACHMAQGKGGFLASDLSSSNTSPDRLRQVILDPANSLPTPKKAVTITTTGGQKSTGALRAQDNFSISIQTLDGAFHYFPNSDITSVEIGVHSLMPSDYRSRLSDSEINDLISYLIRIGAQSAKPDAPSSDDDDE